MTNAILSTLDSKVKATAEESLSSTALSFDGPALNECSPLSGAVDRKTRPPLFLRPYFVDVFHSFPSLHGNHFYLVAEAGRIRADEAEPSSIGKWWFIDVYDARGRRIAEKHIARSPEIFDVAKQSTTNEVGP